MLTKPLNFLKTLQKNNNREWFQSNKKQYEEAKKEFDEFIQELINGITEFDPSLKLTTPKDSIFRINRDIRFSQDKSPYKTNFGAYMAEGGKKSGNASYYFHLEPGNNSFAAGGLYMPPNDHLMMIRQEIDYNQKEFHAILNEPQFIKFFEGITGEKLKRAPKGYKEDHPAIEFLKYKSYIVMHKLEDKTVEKKELKDKTLQVFEAIKPLNDFLRKATTTI